MLRQDKVSVIIPVYNSSTHLERCIDSVINQTYTNIEVILVNDGSTDGSEIICDNFAIKDRRVRVIHKDNGGVSSARNVGIRNATGNYITFVDSDDVIAKDMVEILASSLEASDISIIGHKVVTTTKDTLYKEFAGGSLCVSGLTAIKMMMYECGLDNSVCGLAYNRRIAEGLFFKDNVAYGEDLEFKFHLLLKANIVCINRGIGYYYFNRPGSAMNSRFNPKRFDSVMVALNNLDFAISNSPELIKPAKHKVFLESLTVLRSIKMKAVNKEISDKCVGLVRKFNQDVIKNNEAPTRHRVYAGISMLNTTLLLWLLILKNKLKALL